MAIKITGEGIVNALRVFFGAFMIVVYLGMSVLFMLNFFNFTTTPTWTLARWVFAVILGVYGIYRGDRQVKGIDYYRSGKKADGGE